MKSKNILITGGAGFIGSHLCDYLLNKGHKVICLDNLLTGSINNISKCLNNKNFEFVNHDITIPFFRKNIDEIYNLACPASPIHYQVNPIKTIKTCTAGVINILGLAKENNAKVLQASTSEVYGDPEIHPQSEDYNGNVNPVGPRSCYDEGKRCSETLFMDYYRYHGVKIKIVRIFNTYGPNMAFNDGRVVSNFITQALDDNNITIYGDGRQTRSFLYINDLIRMMNTTNEVIGPINLGNSDEITIINLANQIQDLTKSKSQIIFKTLPKDDPQRRKPNIELANKILGWKPTFELTDGLKRTIKYFKKTYENN